MAVDIGELCTDFLGQSDELINRLRLRKCVQVKAQIVGIHIYPRGLLPVLLAIRVAFQLVNRVVVLLIVFTF